MVYSRQVYKQQQGNMVIEGALQPRMYKGGWGRAGGGVHWHKDGRKVHWQDTP